VTDHQIHSINLDICPDNILYIFVDCRDSTQFNRMFVLVCLLRNKPKAWPPGLKSLDGQDAKETRDASAQPYAGPGLASTAWARLCVRVDLDCEEGSRPSDHRKGSIFPGDPSSQTTDMWLVYSWRVKINKNVSGRVSPSRISSKMTRPHDGCFKGRMSLVHLFRGYPILLRKLRWRQPARCGSSSVSDLNHN